MRTIINYFRRLFGLHEPVVSVSQERKSDGFRHKVYISSEGGLAEYTYPSNSSEAVSLDSVLVSYSSAVAAGVFLKMVDAMGVTGIMGSTDGSEAATSYYFSTVNTNLMPSEKIIISSTNTGLFNVSISLRK